MSQQRKEQWELGRLTERCDALGDRIKALELELAHEHEACSGDAMIWKAAFEKSQATLKLAGEALDGLTKPLYQQGASQNDVVNCIKRRDRDIHAALAAIKACGVILK